jgi:hypothetical protein
MDIRDIQAILDRVNDAMTVLEDVKYSLQSEITKEEGKQDYERQVARNSKKDADQVIASRAPIDTIVDVFLAEYAMRRSIVYTLGEYKDSKSVMPNDFRVALSEIALDIQNQSLIWAVKHTRNATMMTTLLDAKNFIERVIERIAEERAL